MMISGWNKRYAQIQRKFHYNKKQDLEAAIILDWIIKKPVSQKKIKNIVNDRLVFVIGAGPSLLSAVPVLKKYKNVVKIVADSAVKVLAKNKIKPDIIVTDLDGDEKSLFHFGKDNVILVVHAHGDNISKLPMAQNFKNCIGTTQTSPVKKIQNFGGFTDGDRAVFLANYFGAKKIILIGMDFGKQIGKTSNTKFSERKIKIQKLHVGKELLEWLSLKTKSELYTTSSPVKGFKKISYAKLDSIMT